ncbi:MAG: carboxyl transferase domain-containing protein [Myxococcota bacterium]
MVGFVAQNSAFASGQIDIAAAMKDARFIRFCNLYNIPIVFLEDTTGFLPGREQEAGGIVHAGRALLDAIIDVRTPRILVIIRNAFGGAYASFNCYPTGADLVLALPTTRVAVMGPAGKEFVYKDELRKIRAQAAAMEKAQGADAASAWLKAEADIGARYERELMNPREALALGSISRIVQPWGSAACSAASSASCSATTSLVMTAVSESSIEPLHFRPYE